MSSVHACSSLLSDLLLPFSLSPFPRLISPQQGDHPRPCSEPSKAPDQPQDEIFHMSCKICPWEHFPHFLSLLPFLFISICLFSIPLTWQTCTASIYHHMGLFTWKCVLGSLPTFGCFSLQKHLCKEVFGDHPIRLGLTQHHFYPLSLIVTLEILLCIHFFLFPTEMWVLWW